MPRARRQQASPKGRKTALKNIPNYYSDKMGGVAGPWRSGDYNKRPYVNITESQGRGAEVRSCHFYCLRPRTYFRRWLEVTWWGEREQVATEWQHSAQII